MEKIDKFLENLEKYKVSELKDKYVFRISKSYYLRVFLFIAIIAINGIYTYRNIKRLNFILVFLLFLISAYVMYSIYTVLIYKVIVENNKIIVGKNIIPLENIKSLRIINARVGGAKFDTCLELVEEGKKYIIRLNIDEKYKFVSVISKITNVEVK